MRKYSYLIASLFTLALPLTTYADITVNNHSDAYGTGMIGGRCSASLGDVGIMRPQGKMTISRTDIVGLCGLRNCEAQVFMTNNCSGAKIATVTINHKGVVNIVNHSAGEYIVSGTKTNVNIDKHRFNMMNWVKSLF